MKRELFASSKLFAGEDGFLSSRVLGGLTRQQGSGEYPPPRGAAGQLPAGRESRQGQAATPDPVQCSRARPGAAYPRRTDTFAENAHNRICERNKINIWLRSWL